MRANILIINIINAPTMFKCMNRKNDMTLRFPFNDKKNTATITCCHVMKDNNPILYASHDANDGMWQFLCGKEHKTEEAMIVALEEVFIKDKTIGKISDLPLGYIAERLHLGDKWETHSK